MRLNGWQRIGVVLSVIWALGSAIHVRQEQVANGYRLYQLQQSTCLNGDISKSRECSEKHPLQEAMDASVQWSDVAFFAFGPVTAGWLALWIAVGVFRWIKLGFVENSG